MDTEAATSVDTDQDSEEKVNIPVVLGDDVQARDHHPYVIDARASATLIPATDERQRPAEIVGTVTYEYTVDGSVICDMDVAFSGTDYLGGCTDCDFAFDMFPTIEADRATDPEACDPLTWLTFLPGEETPDWGQVTLFHYPVAHIGAATNILGVGITVPGYFAGPYFNGYGGGFISLESDVYPTYGTFDRSENDVAWTYHREHDESRINFFEPCDSAYDGYDPLTDRYDSDPRRGVGSGRGTPFFEDVPCDGERADTYTFSGTGGAVEITVDTVDAESAVDLMMYVNGPAKDRNGDTCVGTTHFADNSYECTYVPRSGYSCPSLVIDTEAQAEYVVYVLGTNVAAADAESIHWDCDQVSTSKYSIRLLVSP